MASSPRRRKRVALFSGSCNPIEARTTRRVAHRSSVKSAPAREVRTSPFWRFAKNRLSSVTTLEVCEQLEERATRFLFDDEMRYDTTINIFLGVSYESRPASHSRTWSCEP